MPQATITVVPQRGQGCAERAMLAARSLPSMLTLPSLSCSSVPVPLIFIVAASSRYGGRPGRSNSAPSCAESGVNACSDRFIPVAAIFSPVPAAGQSSR